MATAVSVAPQFSDHKYLNLCADGTDMYALSLDNSANRSHWLKWNGVNAWTNLTTTGADTNQYVYKPMKLYFGSKWYFGTYYGDLITFDGVSEYEFTISDTGNVYSLVQYNNRLYVTRGVGSSCNLSYWNGVNAWVDEVNLPLPATSRPSKLLLNNNGTLYIINTYATTGGIMHRYESDGTWTEVVHPATHYSVDPNNNEGDAIVYEGVIYAAFNDGLYYWDGVSTDWTLLSSAPSAQKKLRYLYGAFGCVFAGCYDHSYVLKFDGVSAFYTLAELDTSVLWSCITHNFMVLDNKLYATAAVGEFYTGGGQLWQLDMLTVTTDKVDFGGMTAMCYGNIVSTGGANATKRGFVYGVTNQYPNINTNDGYVEETGSFGTGTFSGLFTGISMSIDTIYVRAYAYNTTDGYVYGDILTVNRTLKPVKAYGRISGNRGR